MDILLKGQTCGILFCVRNFSLVCNLIYVCSMSTVLKSVVPKVHI